MQNVEKIMKGFNDFLLKRELKKTLENFFNEHAIKKETEAMLTASVD